MADKILRITFNGICTLNPRPPQGKPYEVSKAYVLMAANPEPNPNDWGAIVAEHLPFIYVPVSILEKPPDTLNTSEDPNLGLCNIYFIDHARVVLDTKPTEGITYHINDLPLAERPGSDDVAPENDIRWLANFNEILQGRAPLRKSVDPPSRDDLDPNVAVVVDLEGGLLQASFPCKSPQPKTFKDAKGEVVPGLKRVLAPEFLIDIPFDEKTSTVKIQLKRLRPSTPAEGPEELILKWPKEKPEEGPWIINVRMGNDTKNETTDYLGKPKRCNARKRDDAGNVILIPRDNDFFLHYRIIDSGETDGPLPHSDIQQITVNGCKGAG